MKGKNKLVDFFIQLPFVNWLIHKSKTTTLPGFSGIPIYQVVSFFIRQVQTIGMTERASAIAFNFVMAIPSCAPLIKTTPVLKKDPIGNAEKQLYV